jgi:hypothetical protein
LLSDTAPGAVDSHSRILASLEGRVVAQQAPRKRSKKPLIAAALAVIGVGALGAWQWQHGQRSDPPIVAAAPAAVKPQGASAAASLAVNPAASGTVAETRVAEAASAPQTAVIVADDTTPAAPASASSSATGDADRLSRALTGGAAPVQAAQAANSAASAPVVAAASAPASALAKPAPANKRLASRPERETAKNRRTEKLAAAHASKRDKRRASAKDDPDADLLAALVARTKPYDAKAAKSASAAAAAKAAQPGGKAQTASVSEQLKACDKGNFFEAQACHWRVCSGHWGKDAACPSAGPASATQSNG